jgi:hypothetical protein
MAVSEVGPKKAGRRAVGKALAGAESTLARVPIGDLTRIILSSEIDESTDSDPNGQAADVSWLAAYAGIGSAKRS